MNIPNKDSGLRHDNDLMMESFVQKLNEEDFPSYGDAEGYSRADYAAENLTGFEGTGVSDTEGMDAPPQHDIYGRVEEVMKGLFQELSSEDSESVVDAVMAFLEDH